MHKRKIKRKGKFVFFKVFLPFSALFVLFLGLYFYMPFLIDTNLVSPLSKISLKSDKRVVEEALLKNRITYSSIDIASDSSFLVNLSDGAKVIITPKKNISSQINSLQLMLNRLTIEGKRIKIVDFRYDRPVVRF